VLQAGGNEARVNEVLVDADISRKAVRAIERMLDFAAARKVSMQPAAGGMGPA
jgi:hypothetical protein